MAAFARFNGIIDEFRDVADFIYIYIEEAHASDGWKFANNYDIKHHRTIEDRIAAARVLNDLKPHCPVFVDNMSGEANRLYGALPDRFFIILDGIIVFEGKLGPWRYKPQEVNDWLVKYFRS